MAGVWELLLRALPLCGYFTAWLFPLFAESYCAGKPPLQDQTHFVFSLKRCHLCARTSLCSHLKSRHSALCSRCPEQRFTSCHSCQHTRIKRSVSEGRKNTQQSNPQCLPSPFLPSYFLQCEFKQRGRNLHSPLSLTLTSSALTAKSRLETAVKAL